MRICYVSSVRMPTERPHGYAVAKMCESFAELGHQVSLITPAKSSFMGEDLFAYYGLARSFRHLRVRSLDLLYWERFGGSLSYWFDFASFIIGAVVMKRHEINAADVLYVREPYLAVLLPRRKVVLEMHTMPSRSWIMRRMLRSVRKINAISHGLAADIGDFCGRTDISIVPDAVDLARFAALPERTEARRLLDLPEAGPLIAYTGNFYRWKGVDTLADAATLVPEAHVVLVGGTDEYDYQRIAAKQGSAPNLVVRRFEDASRMPAYFAAADVLVIPNAKGTAISERHTSPLKLFEYMAVGKPIVASDLPSLREILDDSTAIFFEADDVPALAAAMRLALDPVLARRIGDECRRRVRVYSWEARARTALDNL